MMHLHDPVWWDITCLLRRLEHFQKQCLYSTGLQLQADQTAEDAVFTALEES